ncbi:Cof-type HAD-IIB family hydrolase (plasmid) [Enterococcus gilvus]|jgi:Cof subfamily protein (haloacid dehalogenase superfamily)|uniref:Cof-type HAD-IIB family hydrolase n=1 Tax=Enterococcus gilvus TaxID=160453 RepID=UPI000DF603D0|nr:Cof-type HAD-IIB family hydrolase [Enterococcus gilvus]AXG40030.1 Cof-type HAD-IIB family hydrolase [Enterococcus gilvus]
MKKVVFFDLDGTLCSGGSLQVEPEVLTAFEVLRKTEVLPIIATGRSYYEVAELLDLLKVKNYILSNGCFIRFGEKILQNVGFTPQEIEAILAIASENQVAAGYFNQQGFAVSQLSEVVEAHVSYMGITDVPIAPRFYQQNFVNFMNLYLSEEAEERIYPKIEHLADVVRFAPLAIDVLPKKVSKGTAIQRLLKELPSTELEIYAFGDQMNDHSMFELADYSVAMKQGSSALKQQATYVAKTEKGVLEGLKHYHLLP